MANVFFSTKNLTQVTMVIYWKSTYFILLCDLREQLAVFMCHVKFLSLLTWLSSFDIQELLIKSSIFWIVLWPSCAISQPNVGIPSHTSTYLASSLQQCCPRIVVYIPLQAVTSLPHIVHICLTQCWYFYIFHKWSYFHSTALDKPSPLISL